MCQSAVIGGLLKCTSWTDKRCSFLEMIVRADLKFNEMIAAEG